MAKDAKGHGSAGKGASAPKRGTAAAGKLFPERSKAKTLAMAGYKPLKASKPDMGKYRELERAYMSAKPGKAKDAAKKAMHAHLNTMNDKDRR